MYEAHHSVETVNDQGTKQWETLRHQQYSSLHNIHPAMCMSPQGDSGAAVLEALLAHPGRVMEEGSHPCGLTGECGGRSGT